MGASLVILVFPGGSEGKACACNSGDQGSIPGSGRFPQGNGTPLQYSCLENPMDEGAWWAAVHGVAKSRTQLSNFTFTFSFPRGASGKEPTSQCRGRKRNRFSPWVGKILWRRAWQPNPVFLLEEYQGERSLVGYSP